MTEITATDILWEQLDYVIKHLPPYAPTTATESLIAAREYIMCDYLVYADELIIDAMQYFPDCICRALSLISVGLQSILNAEEEE